MLRPEHESEAALYLATTVQVQLDGKWMSGQHFAALCGGFHVLTAWNPGRARPSRAVNEAANAALRADLISLGQSVFPAIGMDPDSSHSEESYAVIGLTDQVAKDLGAKFGQWAVFRIDVSEQVVLGCFGDWTCARPL